MLKDFLVHGLIFGTKLAYIVVAVEADAKNKKGGPTHSARLSAIVQHSLPVASWHRADGLLDYQ